MSYQDHLDNVHYSGGLSRTGAQAPSERLLQPEWKGQIFWPSQALDAPTFSPAGNAQYFRDGVLFPVVVHVERLL